MSKISKVTKGRDFPDEEHYIFECPGCKECHMVKVFPVAEEGKPQRGWTFNGDFEKPTVRPSLLVNGTLECPNEPRCHSYVTDGMIQYLGDSTHELKGQTIELPEI